MDVSFYQNYLLIFHFHFLKCCKSGWTLLSNHPVPYGMLRRIRESKFSGILSWHYSKGTVSKRKKKKKELSHGHYSNCCVIRTYLIFKQFIYLLFIWLGWVLAAACGIFAAAWGIFHCSTRALRCGAQASLWLWRMVSRACSLSSCSVQGL